MGSHASSNLTQALLQLTTIGSTWVLYLLIALSFISLAIIIERAAYFFGQRTSLELLRQQLHAALAADNWEAAAALCKGGRGLETRVAAFAVANRDAAPEAAERILDGFIAAERRRLDQGLTFLGTLGNNAPFIGLFGTVLGIIDAFHALASNPAGGAATVMTGISEALITTAVGLAVAIPAVIAFNTFQRLVKTKLDAAAALQGLVLGHAADRQRRAQKVA